MFDPIERARGVREVLIPLIGAELPMALLTSPPQYAFFKNIIYQYGLSFWMTLSLLLTLWGMWVLRKSFSVMVEARVLVTCGPYRWIRHPIYAGEFFTIMAIFLLCFSRLNLVFFSLIVVILLLRSYWEEEKLSRVFPDYKKWARTAWWFW